jgi:hypothetical protein
MASNWAKRFVQDDDGEPELVDVTPPPNASAWFLAEMAKHRAEAHVRRVRTVRYATRALAWWLAMLLPLPSWVNAIAFCVTVALALATLLEAERWLTAHLSARAAI